MKKTLLVAAVAAAISSTAGATVVNIDSYTNSDLNPVTLSLAAGTYRLFDVGPGEVAGAAYSAWNPWGGVSGGCKASGGGCTYGWYRDWAFDYGTGAKSAANTGFFSSDAGALAHAKTNDPLSFTLAAPAVVKFWVGDSYYGDNLGGVSVNVVAVPEPETYAMMLAGLGALGAVARRRGTTGA